MIRIVRLVTAEKRNQPVSVAMAAKRAVAASGGRVTSKNRDNSKISEPVASLDVSLKSTAPRSSALTW